MKKLYIGIIAALVSTISDILLLYHPDLFHKYENYIFLFEVDEFSNTWGWILGMIFLPILYIGYKGIKEVADESSKKVLDKTEWLVVFLISFGCVVHSAYHFLPVMHILNNRIEQVEINTIKTIEILFTICYLLFCVIITFQSFKKKNHLLYANRFFNPLFWMLFAFAVFFISPRYGGYLAVSAFNCSIAFYFMGVLVNREKNQKKSQSF